MREAPRVGIFGIGPGSIEPATKLPNATVFYKAGSRELRSIYTTPVKYESLFDEHVPSDALSPMTSMRVITTQETDFRVDTGTGYYMVDYPRVLSHWEDILKTRGITTEVLPATTKPQDVRVEEKDGRVEVNMFGGKYEFDAAVDATGIPAIIASQVETNRAQEDYVVEFVCFGTFPGTIPESEMTLVMGAAGGTSWANKSIYQDAQGKELVDVVFSGWGYKSSFDKFRNGEGRARLSSLVAFIDRFPGIKIRDNSPQNITYGMIRAQRIPTPQSKLVYPTGEAAGIAKPLSGESFNRSLRSGQLAVQAIEESATPKEYHKQLRNEWRGNDIFLAIALHVVTNQLKNSQGGQMDTIGKWFKNNEIDERFIELVEDFVIEGNQSPRLFARFSKDPIFLKNMFFVLKHFGKIKLFGEEKAIKPGWSFAPLEKTSAPTNEEDNH